MKRIPVLEVRIGDHLDLENDPFADADDPTPEFEFCEVSGIEQETPECIRLDFTNYPSTGFPTDHLVLIENETGKPKVRA